MVAAAEIQIMIVDDYKEWRLRLRSFLEPLPGFRVVAEAADGVEAVEKAAQLLPDIVLLDIGMPLLNGIEAAPRIRRASPQSGIIFLTQENDSDIRTAALATGAAAYLLKSTAASELKRTIENVVLNRFQECAPDSPRSTKPVSSVGAPVTGGAHLPFGNREPCLSGETQRR